MERSRFSEERSTGISRQAEDGMRVVALCREYGISDATIYKWRQNVWHGGFRRHAACASLKWRTPRLRKMLAGQTLDISLLKDGLPNNS